VEQGVAGRNGAISLKATDEAVRKLGQANDQIKVTEETL
jgi:hypothetical protein